MRADQVRRELADAAPDADVRVWKDGMRVIETSWAGAVTMSVEADGRASLPARPYGKPAKVVAKMPYVATGSMSRHLRNISLGRVVSEDDGSERYVVDLVMHRVKDVDLVIWTDGMTTGGVSTLCRDGTGYEFDSSLPHQPRLYPDVPEGWRVCKICDKRKR